MTIDEAIEQLQRGTYQSRSTKNTRLREALKLGIEALKHYQIYKRNELIDASYLLPGETKD